MLATKASRQALRTSPSTSSDAVTRRSPAAPSSVGGKASFIRARSDFNNFSGHSGQQPTRPCAPVKKGASAAPEDRRKSSSSSTSSNSSVIVPVQVPHQPLSEPVQIHEQFDAAATGENTLSSKIARTEDEKTRRLLVEAQDRIKRDLAADQQRCRMYVEAEYKEILTKDLPYLQELKLRILRGVWRGKRYKANLELLATYLQTADQAFSSMHGNMNACKNGDAFQQSLFSMRLQNFRTKVQQVKAVQVTLEGIQRRP